jgi:hypothetical protein
LLYRSNKLMYDRETYTLWSHLLGEPVIGPLAGSGIKLEFFPVSLTTWGEWVEEHPDTTVLSRDTGYYSEAAYADERDPESIYYEYRGTELTKYPVWDRDSSLNTKDIVLGLEQDGAYKAYPLDALRENVVLNDSIGGLEVVVMAASTSGDARAYLRDGRVFRPEDKDGGPGVPSSLVDSEGAVWTVTDDALVDASDGSRTLPRVPSRLTYWFGWYAFHPDTAVYGEGGG